MAALPAIPAEQVRLAARAAIGDDDVEVTRWSVDQLAPGAGNPTSNGVFRVSGLVAGAHGTRAWSAVLKRMRLPVDQPGMAEPRMALYWRREIDAYGSGFLDCLPGGVVAPRALHAEQAEPDHASLWLEDLGDMPRQWGDAERRRAVAHLARLHAAYLTGTALPGYPWLTMLFARQWFDHLMPTSQRALAAIRGRARHLSALVALLDDPSRALAVLESLPQTLCHHDTHPDNLALRTGDPGGERLAIIDWQLVGRGPIGEDIGQFLAGIVTQVAPSQRDRVESEVLAAYHAALMSAGVQMSLRDVHRGYYCAAALRQGVFAVYLLAQRMEQATTREAAQSDVEAFIRETRHGHLPALATRAWALSGA
jgi:thiamine kinase-like enzyme